MVIAVANISLTANEKREIEEEEAANEKHMKEVHEKFAPENTKYLLKIFSLFGFFYKKVHLSFC